MIIPVILSGGVGSRLWPLSRATHPKPFIKLADRQSFLQKTFLRATNLPAVSEIIVVTNRDLFFYTKDEFSEITDRAIHQTYLLEPVGRNSTAAIGLAAQRIIQEFGEDATLLVLPADHLISNEPTFREAVERACELASQHKLVTFGIQPDSPNTGFGYIKANGTEVIEFVEKPDLKTAQRYLEDGSYFWNSGMFCMNAGAFWQELTHFKPLIAEQIDAALNDATHTATENFDQYEVNESLFAPIESISVDYAIFESSQNAAIIPCDIGWSDIGSWNEFGALIDPDESGNHLSGSSIVEDSTNCIIQSDDKLIAALGLDNLIIADTADALLVADKSKAQDIRKIVDRLKSENHSTYREFPTVHRPWGTYTVLQEGSGFKLKRIEVKPGASLSLQSHEHRSEHWIVVQGNATVTNGDSIIQLGANQSTYIPAGNKHRLENPNTKRLILIEVQCGSYLGEDDIKRYDDRYGRAT